MSRFGSPDNSSMSVDQLRSRLQDKLTHLRERLAAMKTDPVRSRLVPHAENEIRSTERRLVFLKDRSSMGSGE